MKRAALLAASAAALMLIAAAASAEELSVSISEVNGVTLDTPLTFDFNTAFPKPSGVTGGVLFGVTHASVSDIYNIYFYDFGSGTGQSPTFGGIGVGGGPDGFFTLSFANQFTSGATPGGLAILDDPFPFGTTTVNDASPATVLTVTPVPEPAAWALMLVGFGGLGAAMRSRRGSPATTA